MWGLLTREKSMLAGIGTPARVSPWLPASGVIRGSC